MQPTIPQTTPAAEAARLVRCDLCWCPPGQPCQRRPAGDHLERIITAVKLGLLSRAELAAIVGGLEVIADAVVILEREPELPQDWEAQLADELGAVSDATRRFNKLTRKVTK